MDLKSLTKRAALSLLMSMLCLVAFAQNRQVSGIIKDTAGEPMIGVNVLVKGTTNGTISDFDGKFVISGVTDKSVLVFSYIGYVSQEMPVGDKTSFTIVMQDDTETLDEVVVVGYGQMKKSDLTGSVSSVSSESLVAKGTTSALEALQGSVPGVSITQSSSRAGGGFDIEIRGKSTLGDNKSPLYVVDGIICDDIDFLNPQDIERIDILKDASSTAIYGSRATNGVVIVSTKTAKTEGGKSTKPVVSYDGYYGVKKAARMPDFMDASEFARYRHFRYLNVKEGTIYGAENTWDMTEGNYITAYLTAGGALTGNSYVKDIISSGKETNWRDEVMRTASQQNHYVSISGNGGNVNYHFGMGYQNEGGIYKDDDMKRYNMKGTVDSRINDYFSAGISFNAANTYHTTVDDSAISNAFRLNNLCRAYDDNGNLIEAPGTSDYLGTAGDQFTSTWNPLFDFENSEYNKRTWQILANVYAEVRPLKNLSLKSTFSPSYYNTRDAEFEGSVTSARNNADNRASVENLTKFSWTWDNQINYNLNINDHSLNAMGLVSASCFNQETYNQEAYGVAEAAKWYHLDQASSTTYTSASAYTEWSMLSYALRLNYSYKSKYMLTGTVRWDGSSRFSEDTRWGSFPSAAAAWRISEEDFMGSTRSWLSNLKLRASFGVTGNNYTQGTNYPISIIAEGGEKYYGFADGTGTAVYYPSAIVNKKLTWEKTTEYNIGLDFGFLNNRIIGTVDYYNKTSKDLLMNRQLTYEAGGMSVIDNMGKVKNSGVEVSLSTVNVQTKDWNWTTSFSFSHNKNEILEVNGGKEDDISNSWFIGESINALYNYKWIGIVSDKTMTIPDTQIAKDKGYTPGEQVVSRDYYYNCYGWGEGMPIIEDLDGNGVIDKDDKTIIGKSNPTWTGSISSTLTYKNWDFSFSIYTKQNYDVYSSFHNQYAAYGDRGMQHMNMDFYIPKGTLLSCDYDANGNRINEVYQETTHYGKYPFPTNESVTNAGAGTIWAGSNAKSGASSMNDMADANSKGTPYQVVDGSYWKVKNISLGYTFSKNLINKAKIQSLRLYINVTNPFVFSKYDGFDPEWCGSKLTENGPSSVTYQFGASIKF